MIKITMRSDTEEQLRSVPASPLLHRRAKAPQGSTAEELHTAAAADMGKAASDTAPFIHKLVHEQWYDTAESRQSIGEDLWMRLGIPLNLPRAVHRRLSKQRVGGNACESIVGLTLPGWLRS